MTIRKPNTVMLITCVRHAVAVATEATFSLLEITAACLSIATYQTAATSLQGAARALSPTIVVTALVLLMATSITPDASISRTKVGVGSIILPLAITQLVKAALRQLSRLCPCRLAMPVLASLALCLACLICLPRAMLLVLKRVLIQVAVMILARNILLINSRRMARQLRPTGLLVLLVCLACLLIAFDIS